MHADVLIIGGGAGGLACAITLASAHTKAWYGDRSITVVDDGRSDLHKALLNNAPGVSPGTSGTNLLEHLKRQVRQYPGTSVVQDTVMRIEQGWTCHLASNTTITADHIVVATGYKRCDIEGLPVEAEPHLRGGKPGRITLPHDGVYRIDDDLHVAGLLAGGSSQFAIAAGIGAQVAVEILCGWAGKRTHVHDACDTASS